MVQQRSPPFTIGHDELELFQHMLNNKFVNRSIDQILKVPTKIIRLHFPEDVGKTPGLRLFPGGWRAGDYGINLDREGTIGDKIVRVILVDGYMFFNQKFTYNDIKYEGTENCLPKMVEILNRIVTENQKYETPDLPLINFDMITPVSEIWFAGYNNNPDVQAFQLGFQAQFERKYVEGE